MTTGQLIGVAMDKLAEDEALYSGLADDEGTLLLKWAEGRFGVAVACHCATEADERTAVTFELSRLRAAFGAMTRVVDQVVIGDRGVLLAVCTAVLSDLWNGGY